MTPNQPGQPPKLPIPGVKNLIAVGSGKGGVGKTTVSVNLAISLARLGHPVGLMDADVYGPNVPLMMGINRTPMAYGDRIQPLENYGVKLMSMGFINPGDRPLVWRGPMLHSAIQAPAVSSRRIWSALSSILREATFSASCSGRLPATIGNTGGSLCSIQAMITWFGVAPVSAATTFNASSRSAASGPAY